jgi:hypothetical protein
MAMRLALPVALLVAGCGSAGVAQLPPAAGPARAVATLGDGRRVELLGRARVVELLDGRRRVAMAPAGIGPTDVACLERRWCYVTDLSGDAVLVYAVGDGIELTRRYRLAGGPRAISVDRRRHRLLVTLADRGRRVELVAHGRPHRLRTP